VPSGEWSSANKITSMLRGKERKERIDMQSLTGVDEEDLYTLKINCKGKKTVGKAKERIIVEII